MNVSQKYINMIQFVYLLLFFCGSHEYVITNALLILKNQTLQNAHYYLNLE